MHINERTQLISIKVDGAIKIEKFIKNDVHFQSMAKILIMDDSLMMRSILRNFLKKLGHECIETKDGDEVFETYKTEKPDVVLMDIIVPGKTDGWEGTKKIMQFDHEAKIIMVTSLKEKQDEDNAAALGTVGYIKKPFSMEEIKSALDAIGIK